MADGVLVLVLVVAAISSMRSVAAERPSVSSGGNLRERNAQQDRGDRKAKQAARVGGSVNEQSIDTECDALTVVTTKTSGRSFSLPRGDHGVWREYDQSEAPDGARSGREAVEIARVWLQAQGVMAVQMKIWPESGDWSHVVDYCFRSDGSLARSESMLVTLDVSDSADETNNGVKRLRARYFDRGGREIGRKIEVRNLADGQPVKRRFADMQETIYRTVMDLPFAGLLHK